MRDDPDKAAERADAAARDTPERTASEARGAELRENVALTDARRTEEERAKAEKTAEKAAKEAEKLSRKEKKELEKAERLHAAAEREREQAPARAPETPHHTPAAEAVAGIPGADKLPAAAQRPEVLVGAAFAGTFLLARILKRIFD
jgi:hypothetical protein